MPDSNDVDLTIRAAEAADAEALADLMTQLGYETRTSEMQMRMEAILSNKNYATFVAVNEGKVCGMIGTFTCYTYEHNSPSARILALVVLKEMRGRGVGQALIAAAERDLAQRNIRRVAVDAREHGCRAAVDRLAHTVELQCVGHVLVEGEVDRRALPLDVSARTECRPLPGEHDRARVADVCEGFGQLGDQAGVEGVAALRAGQDYAQDSVVAFDPQAGHRVSLELGPCCEAQLPRR